MAGGEGCGRRGGGDTPATATVQAPRQAPACATCGVALIAAHVEPLLYSIGACAPCEAKRVRLRAAERGANTLNAILDDDTLVHILIFSASGRCGHRTACALTASCMHLRRIVAHRLWRHLCTAPEFMPLVEVYVDLSNDILHGWPFSTPVDWRMLHRTLAVPIRFRSRSWRSWRIDHVRSSEQMREAP